MVMLVTFIHLITAIGAINWGLIGLFNFNLVEYICSMFNGENLKNTVYAIIGSAGLFSLISLFML